MTTYIEAILLRLEAEQSSDPTSYLRAAVAFELLNMLAARNRMLDRAIHYGKLQICQPAPQSTPYSTDKVAAS